jgi:hypothetical protein
MINSPGGHCSAARRKMVGRAPVCILFGLKTVVSLRPLWRGVLGVLESRTGRSPTGVLVPDGST